MNYPITWAEVGGLFRCHGVKVCVLNAVLRALPLARTPVTSAGCKLQEKASETLKPRNGDVVGGSQGWHGIGRRSERKWPEPAPGNHGLAPDPEDLLVFGAFCLFCTVLGQGYFWVSRILPPL